MRPSVLVLTIFIAAIPLSSGQDHSQSIKPDDKTTHANANGSDNPSLDIQGGTPHTAAKSPNEQGKSEQDPRPWLTHAEWVMAILTLVYVLLTAFYAWTSHKTLKAIEDQGKHAKDDAASRDMQFADQLQVSRDTANAAQASAKIAQDALKAQELAQRQWVSLEKWSVTPLDQPHIRILSFQIVNPTRLPLTLHLLNVTISGKLTTEGFTTILTPTSPHRASVRFELPEADRANYAQSGAVIDLSCEVFFADWAGIHWEHCFERILSFGPTGPVMVLDARDYLRESGVPGEPGARDAEN